MADRNTPFSRNTPLTRDKPFTRDTPFSSNEVEGRLADCLLTSTNQKGARGRCRSARPAYWVAAWAELRGSAPFPGWMMASWMTDEVGDFGRPSLSWDAEYRRGPFVTFFIFSAFYLLSHVAFASTLCLYVPPLPSRRCLFLSPFPFNCMSASLSLHLTPPLSLYFVLVWDVYLFVNFVLLSHALPSSDVPCFLSPSHFFKWPPTFRQYAFRKDKKTTNKLIHYIRWFKVFYIEV